MERNKIIVDETNKQWQTCLAERFSFWLRESSAQFDTVSEDLFHSYALLCYALKTKNVSLANQKRSYILESYVTSMSPIDLPAEKLISLHHKSFEELFCSFSLAKDMKKNTPYAMRYIDATQDEIDAVADFCEKHCHGFYEALESYNIKKLNDFLKDLKWEEKEK